MRCPRPDAPRRADHGRHATRVPRPRRWTSCRSPRRRQLPMRPPHVHACASPSATATAAEQPCTYLAPGPARGPHTHGGTGDHAAHRHDFHSGKARPLPRESVAGTDGSALTRPLAGGPSILTLRFCRLMRSQRLAAPQLRTCASAAEPVAL